MTPFNNPHAAIEYAVNMVEISRRTHYITKDLSVTDVRPDESPLEIIHPIDEVTKCSTK